MLRPSSTALVRMTVRSGRLSTCSYGEHLRPVAHVPVQRHAANLSGHPIRHSSRRLSSLSNRRQRHASSTALSGVTSSPLRSRDGVSESERRRALRLHQKIVSNSTTGEGLGKSLVAAAEGCLDVLARLEPQQQNTRNRKRRNKDAPANMALTLINYLRSQEDQGGKEIVTGQMFEYAIQALAKQSGRADRAYDLLNEYISKWESKECECGETPNPMRPPNSILISSVINACAKDPARKGSHMADQLLRQMIRLHETYSNVNGASLFAPNKIAFTAVIDGWSRRGDAEKAQALLDQMIALEIRPSVVSYNACLHGWSQLAEHKKMAMENAEKLFQHMLEMPGMHPDVHSYASLLLSLTNSRNQPSGVNRAADILLGMEQALDDSFSREGLTDATMPSVVVPNEVCYNTVVHGYSKSKRPMEAEEWLCRMVERHEKYPLVAPAPNERTFNAAILAWAKSGRPDSGQKAQDLLEAIEGMTKDNGQKTSQRAATEAMVQPDIFGYNIVLDGWRLGSSIESAMGAEKLLRSMERKERFAVPDRTSYNTVIDAFCKAGRTQQRQQHHQGRRQMETNDIIFAQRAEDLLYQMDAAGVPPDTWSFNTVLNAWARSGLGQKAADHATALLMTMEQLHQQDDTKYSTNEGIVHPDARSYSAVIDAIARSGATDAPGRAAAILSRMEDNGILPNAYTLNGILNCWAKNSRDNVFAAQKADEILRRMEESDGDRKSYPKPDLVSYCIVTVAFAWNRSDANKAAKARDVLDRMLKYVRSHGLQEERHAREKLQSAYNSVLSACAHMHRSSNADDVERAREIALLTYDELHGSSLVEPNEETYYVFLLICGNLFKRTFVRGDGNNANTRKRLVEATMQECLDRGLATERVRRRFAEHQPNPVVK